MESMYLHYLERLPQVHFGGLKQFSVTCGGRASWTADHLLPTL